jgi:hypothetical protein
MTALLDDSVHLRELIAYKDAIGAVSVSHPVTSPVWYIPLAAILVMVFSRIYGASNKYRTPSWLCVFCPFNAILFDTFISHKSVPIGTYIVPQTWLLDRRSFDETSLQGRRRISP